MYWRITNNEITATLCIQATKKKNLEKTNSTFLILVAFVYIYAVLTLFNCKFSCFGSNDIKARSGIFAHSNKWVWNINFWFISKMFGICLQNIIPSFDFEWNNEILIFQSNFALFLVFVNVYPLWAKKKFYRDFSQRFNNKCRF